MLTVDGGVRSSVKVKPVAVLFLSLLFLLMVFGGYVKVLMILPGKGGSSLLVSVILLAAILLVLLRRINFDSFLTILLTSIAVFMMSLLSALDVTEAARYVLVFIAATVVYVVVFSYSFHFGYRTFMLPALVTFLIIVFSQLWQYTFPHQYHSFAENLLTNDAFKENFQRYLGGRFGGLTALPAQGALCLILLASVVMASLFGKDEKRTSWTHGTKFFLLPVGIFCLTGTGILLSGFRTALVSFCVWCLFGFYAVFFGRRISAFGKLLFIILGFFVALPIAVYQLFLMFQEQARFLSIYSRFDHWKAALGLFMQHPLMGIGINNYRFYTESVGGVGIFSEITHVHNSWIQILAETGIIGMLVFLTSVFFCMRSNFLCVKIAHKYREYNLLFLVGGTCAFGLYTLASNPVHDQQNLLLFIALQAIINSRLARAGIGRVFSFSKSIRRGLYRHPQLQRLAELRRVPGVGAAADLSQLPYRCHCQQPHRRLYGRN